IRNDPEVGTIFNPPLAARVVAHDAPACARFMLDGLLTPNLLSEETLVLEQPCDGSLRPTLAARPWNALCVQALDDTGQADAFSGPFKNATDDFRFRRIDLNSRPDRDRMTVCILFPRVVGHDNLPIAVLPRAGRKSPVHLPCQAALDLLGDT